jgi:uridylate kinase
MPSGEAVFRRVLLKLSGEALAGERGHGIDAGVTAGLAAEVAEAQSLGVELGIVVGAGNLFRGGSEDGQGLDRVTADHIGMLGTVMNALALRDALERAGLVAIAMSAIAVEGIAPPFDARHARSHLERGHVVVFGGGTGNPLFTTDTAAALRAVEIGAEVFLKATQVDGVYTADPHREPSAELLPEVGYEEALQRRLRVLDATAFAFCRENELPIRVFNLSPSGNIVRVLRGDRIGSVVR